MASRTRRAASGAARYARRGYSGLKSRGLNLNTAIGGAASTIADRYIPGGWGAPVGAIGAGILTKNQFSTDIGMFALGQRLGGMLPTPGGSGGSSNGGVL